MKSESSEFPITPWLGEWVATNNTDSKHPTYVSIFEEGHVRFSYADKPEGIGLYAFIKSDYDVTVGRSEKYCLSMQKLAAQPDMPMFLHICAESHPPGEDIHVHIYGSSNLVDGVALQMNDAVYIRPSRMLKKSGA